MSLGRGLIYLHFYQMGSEHHMIFCRLLVHKNILNKTISLEIIETYTT